MYFILSPPPHPSFIFSFIFTFIHSPKPNTWNHLQVFFILSQIENHLLSPVKVFFLKYFSGLLFAPFLHCYCLDSVPHLFLILPVPPILEAI